MARLRLLSAASHRTNRWTGATASVFRIMRDPAKLLGNAVARSTQTLGSFLLLTYEQLVHSLIHFDDAASRVDRANNR